MPLEPQAWHASVIQEAKAIGACHLSSWRGTPNRRITCLQRAWHARPWACHTYSTFQRTCSSVQQRRGTPDPGRATLVQVSRGKKKRKEARACHLSSKA
ncbi:uncharacterized protein DS421_20g694520 [Arachis hypogaea]|nr:uncharacterized protein DS421_20g694520 [Arachis hypogaea]